MLTHRETAKSQEFLVSIFYNFLCVLRHLFSFNVMELSLHKLIPKIENFSLQPDIFIHCSSVFNCLGLFTNSIQSFSYSFTFYFTPPDHRHFLSWIEKSCVRICSVLSRFFTLGVDAFRQILNLILFFSLFSLSLSIWLLLFVHLLPDKYVSFIQNGIKKNWMENKEAKQTAMA